MIGIRRDRAATVTRAARRTVPAALIVMAGLGLAACSESARLSGATAGSGGGPAGAPPQKGGGQVIGEKEPRTRAKGGLTSKEGRAGGAAAHQPRPAGG